MALAQVAASTWFARTVWKVFPSTEKRISSTAVDRSHSAAYVWKPPWQLVPGQTRWPPMPEVSLHGPPGLVPQCRVAQTLLMPWTFSMMSISPMPGQFHQLPR